MSIAFRLKYALGLIPSTDQLDAKWEKLIKMRDDLNQMEGSPELKQFEDLKNLVASSAFQHHKREIETLQYSGSEEEKLISEYKTLAKSHAIKNFKEISASARLVRLQQILEGSVVNRFLDLQKEVKSSDFKNRKATQKRKVFAKTPDYAVLKEFQQLRKSPDIRFWLKFSNSESYNLYLETVGSRKLRRFEELKEVTTSTEFKNRIAYLQDKKRFLKSDEFKTILSFKEMDNSKFMTDYRKLKKARELDFFEKWAITFEENFSEKVINAERWESENWWGHKMTGSSFSQADEMQCYQGQKNIELNNHTLSIWTRKDKVVGNVWNPAIGLMPKQFVYSSSIINNAGSFRMKEGILEAKVRFKNDATITSAFSLTGEKPFPQIDLFRSTAKGVGMGIIENQGTVSAKYKKLNGLSDKYYHIFRLELFNNQLVWKINGVEVYQNSISLRDPLFFHLLTSLHGTVNEHLLPHQFEIDWIRCFAKKS